MRKGLKEFLVIALSLSVGVAIVHHSYGSYPGSWIPDLILQIMGFIALIATAVVALLVFLRLGEDLNLGSMLG